jgi:hypothetical protein
MSDEERVLVCCRVADIVPPVASTVESCGKCGKAVWRALSSPEVDLIICMQCAEAQIRADQDAGKAIEIEGPTDEQRKDIKKWRDDVRGA